MDVTLKEITADNYELVSELELTDEQQNQLAHNGWSMLQSHYVESANARAVYLDDEVVGFIMWVYVSRSLASIWRLMVDHKHQKKGIGRKALDLALEEIKTCADIREVEIGYSTNNVVAQKLYAKVGFRQLALEKDEDEYCALMELAR